MKTLTSLLSVAVWLCTFQCIAQNTAAANLSVQLNSIQSIRINPSQNEVSIALNTASEYLNGKSASQPDHIEIMSSTNYEVKVSASSHLNGEAATIDVGTVTLTPSQGSIGGNSNGISLSTTALSLADNTIVQSQQGDIKR